MSCKRIQRLVPPLFRGRCGYFTQPNPVSFVTNSRSSVLSKQLENALVEIKHALIRMFNQWQRSFTEHQPSAPVQFRFLLATAVECNVQDYILRLSVISSPHFLDPVFTKTLVNRLVNTINSADGEIRTLAMLCFCVLCAIDSKSFTVSRAGNNK